MPDEATPLCGGLQGGPAWDAQREGDTPFRTIGGRDAAAVNLGDVVDHGQLPARGAAFGVAGRIEGVAAGLVREGRPGVGDFEIDGIRPRRPK